jgi:hypothetical protein
MLICAKLQIGKRGQKTEVTGRSALRRRMSALDSSIIEEEEEDDDNDEEDEEEEAEEKKKPLPICTVIFSNIRNSFTVCISL